MVVDSPQWPQPCGPPPGRRLVEQPSNVTGCRAGNACQQLPTQLLGCVLQHLRGLIQGGLDQRQVRRVRRTRRDLTHGPQVVQHRLDADPGKLFGQIPGGCD